MNRLLGKTLIDIYLDADKIELIFFTQDGLFFKMFHYYQCCETITIEDITGDLSDLIGSPILVAEKRTNHKDSHDFNGYDGSCTWTFYELATIKGSVTIRWLGESNGYYSEEVDFIQIDKNGAAIYEA